MTSEPETGAGRGRQLLSSLGSILQKARRDHSPFTRSDSPHCGANAVGTAAFEEVGCDSPEPTTGGKLLQQHTKQQQQALIQRQLDHAMLEFEKLQCDSMANESSYSIPSALDQAATPPNSHRPEPSGTSSSHDNKHGDAAESTSSAACTDQGGLMMQADGGGDGSSSVAAQLAEALTRLAGRDQQVEVLMQQVR